VLGAARRDGFSEAFWAMVGAAIVAIPSAGRAAVSYISGRPIDAFAILDVVIFLVAVSVAGTIWAVGASRSKTAINLLAQIRARTRQSG
jgi:hypothetical protein